LNTDKSSKTKVIIFKSWGVVLLNSRLDWYCFL